jgi:hypothetical protein
MTHDARNPRTLFWLMLAGAVVAALGWFGLLSREPVYQGKTLTDWLYDKTVSQFMPNDIYGHIHNELWEAVVAGGYAARKSESNSSYLTNTPEDPAIAATRQIGTNAIPRVLDLSASRPGLLERGQDLIGPKLPRLANFLYQKQMFQTAEGRRIAAWKGFCALGTNAESALPTLTKMLQRPDADFLLGCTIAVIGPKGRRVLLDALTNGDSGAIDVAAFCLGNDSGARASAVPALVRLIKRPRGEASYQVLGAIGRLGGDPELVIPALTRFLEGTEPAGGFITESMAMLVLGLYGEQSRSAVPVLLKHYEDPDTSTRQLIRVVLKHIDPEHVEQLLGRAPSPKDDEDPWWGGPVE